MYIKSLNIINYRLFYGENHFNFLSNEEKSLNIFFGENGSGKSSLIEAIYWCLYGVELSEFGSEPIYNDYVADEVFEGDDFQVNVELSLLDDFNKELIFNRSISFYKDVDGKIKSGTENFVGYCGEAPFISPILIINQIFKKELFHLIYINGDYDFFNCDFEQYFKQILFSNTQSNIISNAYVHLKKSHDKFLKRYQKMDSEVHYVVTYNKLVEDYEEVCIEISNKYDELDGLYILKEEYQDKSASKELFIKKERLLREKEILMNDLIKMESNYSKLVLSSFPIAVLFCSLGSKSYLLKDSFEKFNEENILKMGFDADIFKLKQDLLNLRSGACDASSYIKNISHISNRINYVSTEIDSINELLRVEEPLIEEISSIEKKINHLNHTIDNLKYHESLLKKDMRVLDKKIKNIKLISDEFQKKDTFYRTAIDSLNYIEDKLFKDVLNEINDSVSNIFLHDFKMSGKFSDVIITENFEFKIVKNSGKIILLADLSYGEKYILYLSFIVSIQDLFDSNFPLIIDTQFLNFDKKYWLKFLNLLKNNKNQCFLLFNENVYDENTKLNIFCNINSEYELKNVNDKIKVINYENSHS